MLDRLKRVVWRWLPHRCWFVDAERRTDDGRRVLGVRCHRCGTVVWFNVRGRGDGCDRS